MENKTLDNQMKKLEKETSASSRSFLSDKLRDRFIFKPLVPPVLSKTKATHTHTLLWFQKIKKYTTRSWQLDAFLRRIVRFGGVGDVFTQIVQSRIVRATRFIGHVAEIVSYAIHIAGKIFVMRTVRRRG